MKYTSLLVSCLFFLVPSALAQHRGALDLKAEPGASPGVIVVAFFPSLPETQTIELTLRDGESERRVVILDRSLTLEGLASGTSYSLSAVGLSESGEAVETSPVERVVAP